MSFAPYSMLAFAVSTYDDCILDIVYQMSAIDMHLSLLFTSEASVTAQL